VAAFVLRGNLRVNLGILLGHDFCGCEILRHS
jgi:hypothetical protein